MIWTLKTAKKLATDLVAEITSLDTDPDSTARVKDTSFARSKIVAHMGET